MSSAVLRRLPLSARVLLLLAPVLLGIPGCAFFSQPANVEATRADVEAMREDQAELLALVREGNARLAV